MSFEHLTVLRDETVKAIISGSDGCYVDATFGRGGHTRLLLEQLGPNARVIGFDKDPAAIAVGQALSAADPRFQVIHASFASLAVELQTLGLLGAVDGIMADLGVSSPQLDDAERGFSFMHDGPLDMRMDCSQGISAADWLAQVAEAELADVLKTYGEERFAKRIARAIVQARATTPIVRTKQLADIVAAAHPAWERHKHPATRAFQAIRIAINAELDDIQDFLAQTLQALKPDGVLAVISFHSLEDRLVKQFIQKHERGDDFPPGLPVTIAQLRPQLRRVGKAIEPSEAEVERNPRARSARLRVAKRLAVAA